MLYRRHPASTGRSLLRASAAIAGTFAAFAASAATITVNSLLDDVYVNATGSTFSDAALMPLFSSIGFAPAATLRRPSATRA